MSDLPNTEYINNSSTLSGPAKVRTSFSRLLKRCKRQILNGTHCFLRKFRIRHTGPHAISTAVSATAPSSTLTEPSLSSQSPSRPTSPSLRVESSKEDVNSVGGLFGDSVPERPIRLII